MKFTDVGGSLEACYDGMHRVVLRQKGTGGPNFHLTRQSVLELLGLFHSGRGSRDEFVVFEAYEEGRCCGSVALCLSWSEADVLIELRSKGYPLDRGDGHVAVFDGWPSDREFTLKWGEVVFRFAVRGLEGELAASGPGGLSGRGVPGTGREARGQLGAALGRHGRRRPGAAD